MNPERFQFAREINGFTQAELIRRIKEATGRTVARSSIAEIETGRLVPSLDLAEAIAQATGFEIDFFEEPDPPTFPSGSLIMYRAKSVVSSKESAQARRHAQLLVDIAFRLYARIDPLPVQIPDLRDTPPAEAAQIARSALGFSPDRPIANLVRAIERAGVLVLAVPMERDPVDAFSTWVGDRPQVPCMVLLAGTAPDRQRWSVAHELGHLVMHRSLSGGTALLEDEANRFAAEFLTPLSAMESEITEPVTLQTLRELKGRWHVSMRSLINRAYEVRAITPRQRKYLFMKMNAEYGGRSEPTVFLPERPRGLQQMLEMVYAPKGSSVDFRSAARDLKVPAPRLRSILALYVGTSEAEGSKVLQFPKP